MSQNLELKLWTNVAHENEHIKMRVNTINPEDFNTKWVAGLPMKDRDHLKNPEDILHPTYTFCDESIGSNRLWLRCSILTFIQSINIII